MGGYGPEFKKLRQKLMMQLVRGTKMPCVSCGVPLTWSIEMHNKIALMHDADGGPGIRGLGHAACNAKEARALRVQV